MGTIKLYVVTGANVGTQFILRDHPALDRFAGVSKKVNIKRLNMEQYFRGVNRDYRDHTKVMYGPVFGMDDPRNGFIYEHTNGELIVVDENDIPITYETCDVIMGDLSGILQADTTMIPKEIITDYNAMDALQDMIANSARYNEMIRSEWVPDKSFLVID